MAFIHRFGSALNVHTHFHVCAMDGVFEPDGESVRFHAAPAPGIDDIEAVQAAVRRRILRAFQRCGWLERADRLEMEQWQHGGGFSLDASVGIAGRDRRGRERLLRYCARPPLASERLEWIDAHRVRYRLPKPRPDGSGELILSPPRLTLRPRFSAKDLRITKKPWSVPIFSSGGTNGVRGPMGSESFDRFSDQRSLKE